MEADKKLEEAWLTIQRLEQKYKDDPNWKKMPHMAFGIGDSVKRELDEKYGINYVKDRLKLEKELGLIEDKSPSIEKKTE